MSRNFIISDSRGDPIRQRTALTNHQRQTVANVKRISEMQLPSFWNIRDPPTLPDKLPQSACSHLIALPRPRYSSSRNSSWRMPVDLGPLIKYSEYFSTLVRYSNERVLQLPWNELNFLDAGFSAYIKFANDRSEQIEVTDDNVIDLYMTADFFLSQQMRARALEHIAMRCKADVNFALRLLTAVEGFWLPELDKAAMDAVLANFPIIVDGTAVSKDQWLELSLEQVKRVLSHNELNCSSEKQVLRAAHRWLLANPAKTVTTEHQLAKCVRFSLLHRSERDRLSLQYSAFFRWAPASRSIIMANNSASVENQLKTDKCREPHEVVLVFGGWGKNPLLTVRTVATQTGGSESNIQQEQQQQPAEASTTGPQAACQLYNPRANSWLLRCPSDTQLPPGHIGQLGQRVYSGCLLVNGVIHIIGGYDGHQALRTVWRYNLRRPSIGWHIGSCMRRKRYYVCCAATQSGVMYAIGGHTGENVAPTEHDQRSRITGRLRSVERMKPGQSVWMEVASMLAIRSDAGAAAVGERIFVAGGFDGVNYHDTAEIYDPDIDQWTLLSSMRHPRSGVSLVAIGDVIYAVGGNDGQKRLRSIEKYEVNGPSDRWEEVGRMLQAKSNLSAVALDGGTRILSVGGWSDDGQPGVLGTSEIFYLRKKISTPCADASFAASATAACVVTGRQLVEDLLRQA